MKYKQSSLIVRFGLLLLLSTIAAAMLFAIVRYGGGAYLESYFEKSGFQQECNRKRVMNFQSYILTQKLSAKNTAQITKWVKTQPLILLEIYRSNMLLYTSSAPNEMLENEGESPHYSWISYYHVTFSDGDADVVIYADDSYRVFSHLTIVSLVLAVVTFLSFFLFGIQNMIRYICQLNDEIKVMEGGNLELPVTVRGNDELSSLAQSLDSMRIAFKEQKESEAELFQANQTMITQMTHDLRTPMTVLQIYSDILKYNRCPPEQVNDYLNKIDGKVAQMKQLSENLFEYSLVFREQKINLEPPILFRDALHDLLSESVAYLSNQGFLFDIQFVWPPVKIRVYSPYLKRIIDNITSNISKYAACDFALKIHIGTENDTVFLTFENKIAPDHVEKEGTHIGIQNIKTMMEKMGGHCMIQHTDSMFQITLLFPAAAEEIQEDTE